MREEERCITELRLCTVAPDALATPWLSAMRAAGRNRPAMATENGEAARSWHGRISGCVPSLSFRCAGGAPGHGGLVEGNRGVDADETLTMATIRRAAQKRRGG
jgi:hypothetical protein